MAEGAVTFGLLKRVPYASSTDTVFYQFKRVLGGYLRFQEIFEGSRPVCL